MVLPLTVKGNTEKNKLAIKTIELAKQIDDTSVFHKVLAGILTFSDKFLDTDYSKKVRDLMYMTKVERMIFDEGEQSGIQKGLLQGEQRGEQRGIQKATDAISALNLALLADQRYSDLELASRDGTFRAKLFAEYGIQF